MQTLNVTVPQPLRVLLQHYQNQHGIDLPEAAILRILNDHLQTWQLQNEAQTPTLPAMYDAEDGPCEVIESFNQPE